MADIQRKSGIYALGRCDGGPLASADLAVMGLTPSALQDWSARGRDRWPSRVSDYSKDGVQTIVVGEVEEAGTSAAHTAASFLARHGSDTPRHLIGEWSLLQRRADGAITAMLSAARRDPLFYAQSGPRIAFAPDLFALGQLDWVSAEFDTLGVLCRMGRENVRRLRGARTLLKGVRELHPGESLTLSPDGHCATARCQVLTSQPRFTGTYADAVAATDDLLAAMFKSRLSRAPRAALLLSGGLDSSLLAAFMAEVGGADPLALTLIAPPGSGVPDELPFAARAAQHLGLPLHPVAPAPSRDAYRPDPQIFIGQNGPPQSNRHFQTSELQAQMQELGAGLLVNGTYGEMTATVRLPLPHPLLRLRRIAARTWHTLRRTAWRERDPTAFHVRLAPHRLAHLPPEIVAAPELSDAEDWDRDLFGYIPGISKGLRRSNEFTPGALRMDFPYRDLRLLRLFAGFPIKTLIEGGDRAVARSLLDGRLPDDVRLRRQGMPASPDQMVRLQRQADPARARIAAFRKAGVDDWLDLDWLDIELGRIAAHGPDHVGHANEVQLTAMAAEFFLWWQNRS